MVGLGGPSDASVVNDSELLAAEPSDDFKIPDGRRGAGAGDSAAADPTAEDVLVASSSSPPAPLISLRCCPNIRIDNERSPRPGIFAPWVRQEGEKWDWGG